MRLLDRKLLPRHHIGKSLIPKDLWVLSRLGGLPEPWQNHLAMRHSVRFVAQRGRLFGSFYFADQKPHDSSQTWPALRQEFHQITLEHAREHGVDVVRACGCAG